MPLLISWILVFISPRISLYTASTSTRKTRFCDGYVTLANTQNYLSMAVNAQGYLVPCWSQQQVAILREHLH